MSISKKILKHLEEKKYKFEIVEHKTTYTAFDTARTAQKQGKKVKPEEIVKALVVKTDKDYSIALVPSNRRLDKKKLLKAINVIRKKSQEKTYASLDLAKELWMKKHVPGKVGATPAFKELLRLDIFIDATLARQKNLYIGSGEYEYSIKVPTKQYLKNEMPVKGSFGTKSI